MFVFLRLFRILILAPAGLLHAHKYCDHLVELETLAAQVGVVCHLPPATSFFRSAYLLLIFFSFWII